jgi:hypothetical protein
MTLEQVKALFPNAIRPLEGRGFDDGSETLLTLENFTLVNKQFSVRFIFKEGKLIRVNLTLKEKDSFDYVIILCESLTKALRVKYDPEVDHRVGGLLEKSTWLFGRTNIDLIAVAFVKEDANLYIDYSLKVWTEADKL